MKTIKQPKEPQWYYQLTCGNPECGAVMLAKEYEVSDKPGLWIPHSQAYERFFICPHCERRTFEDADHPESIKILEES